MTKLRKRTSIREPGTTQGPHYVGDLYCELSTDLQYMWFSLMTPKGKVEKENKRDGGWEKKRSESLKISVKSLGLKEDEGRGKPLVLYLFLRTDPCQKTNFADPDSS